ncbi:septum site-determining protein Ssd [uncultured Streptomyces sp.]|uniref:septum site-determining protein Ssd n=1 Tax=uncultured Streptomyces sp. TaxID=174707 RepID=UPI0026018B49|nr:septum site-determining protein Ssd [uncultured Streptomyces sp.]
MDVSLAGRGTASASLRGGGPLIVTEDVELLDDLLRLCAAAGTEPEVHHRPPERRGAWELAPLVLVGDDAVARCLGTARRRGVMLVGRTYDDPDVWRRAVEIGAEYVLRLPDAEGWLADRIATAAEGAERPALTIGVIGGSGGAGASTLACALALSAAASDRRTTLIDADCLGGGIDVLLGGEHVGGSKWPAFARSRGRLDARALAESLPVLRGVHVLSWGRDDDVVIPPQAARAVLAAARRGGGAVVVDLPRRTDGGLLEMLAQLDLCLLVVPGELRSVAAAKRVAALAGAAVDDVRVAVRGPFSAGLDAAWVARSLGLPLVGEVPPEPGLPDVFGERHAAKARPHGPLARFCEAFWDRATADADALLPGDVS